MSLLPRGIERRLRVAALDLDDREHLVKARSGGLQLNGPAHRPLGLIEAVEPREITCKEAVPDGPQRIGGERLLRELDRRLHLTESRKLGSEIELRHAVIGSELERTS